MFMLLLTLLLRRLLTLLLLLLFGVILTFVADKFVALTGFGNAAGLLAMRGLFGMSQHTEEDTAQKVKKVQEEEEERERKRGREEGRWKGEGWRKGDEGRGRVKRSVVLRVVMLTFIF